MSSQVNMQTKRSRDTMEDPQSDRPFGYEELEGYG